MRPDAGKCIGRALIFLVLIISFPAFPAIFASFFHPGEEVSRVTAMDLKKILIGGIAGGILLFAAQFAFSMVGNLIAPYDVFAIGGMRARDDPVMLLFFAYPFVLSFTSAIAFDRVKGALTGSCCGGAGLAYGLILFLLVTVPGMFVIFSSMNYPLGFYIGNFLVGIIGFPAVGMLYARIWGK
jgi:hypothetical protein